MLLHSRYWKQRAQMILHDDYDFIQDNQENKYKPLNPSNPLLWKEKSSSLHIMKIFC
jgi:hypothetical protein